MSADPQATARLAEEELAALAGDPDWCANYDYNDIPGLLAEIRRLREVEAAVAAVVSALPGGEDEEMGVYWFDSFRGAYCPCCYPQWDDARKGHSHDPACPLRALVRVATPSNVWLATAGVFADDPELQRITDEAYAERRRSGLAEEEG